MASCCGGEIRILEELFFLTVAQLSFAAAFTICPTTIPCHCVRNEIVYCAFARLTKVPYFTRFAHTWHEIDLSENLIGELQSGAFRGINVVRLNLRRNAIATLHENAFDGVVRMRALDLSHNVLTALPAGAFAGLAQTRRIKLRYNQLTRISVEAFDGVPLLEELDLTGNDLTEVPSSVFLNLPELEMLALQNNKLRTIHAHAFNGLSNLRTLDLGNAGDRLQIHEDAFCGLEPVISHTEPGVIDWSGLDTLLLDHNGLRSVDGCLAQVCMCRCFMHCTPSVRHYRSSVRHCRSSVHHCLVAWLGIPNRHAIVSCKFTAAISFPTNNVELLVRPFSVLLTSIWIVSFHVFFRFWLRRYTSQREPVCS